jgi:hypothetical protein
LKLFVYSLFFFLGYSYQHPFLFNKAQHGIFQIGYPLKVDGIVGVHSTVVNDFAEFPLVQIDKTIIVKAMRRYQGKALSFWDSLIVEAALQAGCTQLLTEDMQDGLVIDRMTIRNPF